MNENTVLFKNISLNQFIIPEVPILESVEDWDETVNLTYKYNDFMLDRFTHRYHSLRQRTNLEDIITQIKSKIVNPYNNFTIELIHKSSYSGLPYQLCINIIDENEEKIEIYFDGFIFFMTVKKYHEVINFHNLIQLTSSELDFRNTCMDIINDLFKLNISTIFPPFWDMEIINLKPLALSTLADYPAFELISNDNNYATFTNVGDKFINTPGKKYSIYFAEDKQYIRDRICHDMIIHHELHNFIQFIKQKNSFAIEANTKFINSLKGLPGNIFSFFKRHKSWKNLEDLPTKLLNIESMLPKYEMVHPTLTNIINHMVSYINIPKTLWITKEDHDVNLLEQKEANQFFQLQHEAQNSKGFSILNKDPKKPIYTSVASEIKNVVDQLNKNVTNAIKNLNNVTTMYSTNFGFDALWIAIITLIVAVLSILGLQLKIL